MPMDIDEDKVDQAVLALLSLGRHDGNRTWKGFDSLYINESGKHKSVSAVVAERIFPVHWRGTICATRRHIPSGCWRG
jgi:hypothetical protein